MQMHYRLKGWISGGSKELSMNKVESGCTSKCVVLSDTQK